jgi:surface polysaccharide O-acyltransferase-like enzyme
MIDASLNLPQGESVIQLTPRRNNLIDGLRATAIIFVIILHLDLQILGIYADILRMAARWAVPFFFIISGYFAGKQGLTISLPKRRKQIKKLAVLVIFGNLIYLPLFLSSTPDRTILSNLNHILCHGSAFHLWFLNTLFFGQFLISIPKSETYAQISAALLGIAIPILNFHPYDIPALSLIVTLGQSIPYLALGVFLGKIPISRWIGFTCVLLGGAMQISDFYFETLAGNHSQQIYLGTNLLAFGIVALAISHPSKKPANKPPFSSTFSRYYNKATNTFSTIGRDYVLGIYIIHIYIRIVINLVARMVGIYDKPAFRLGSALLIFLASILVLHFWKHLLNFLKPHLSSQNRV